VRSYETWPNRGRDDAGCSSLDKVESESPRAVVLVWVGTYRPDTLKEYFHGFTRRVVDLCVD
jgi:hypothetical protein